MKTSDTSAHYEGKDLESMANARNYYQWIISEFKDYIDSRIVIEVGAGSGNFSEYILGRQPRGLIAVEPSSEMAKRLKQKLSPHASAQVINGFLKNHQRDLVGQADTVFYINVLEHVENDTDELRIVYDILKPGGYLCIYVPALSWLYGSFDEGVGHYRRYSKKDLKTKLLEAGFEIKRIYYSDILGIIPWLINFRLFKSHNLNDRSVLLYDKYAVPLIKTQEKLWKPPIGKNLWALARKPK